MKEHKIKKIFDGYISGLQKYYPSLRYSGRFSMYSGDEPLGGEFSLGTDDNVLTNTDHFISQRNLQIVHFTSFKSGISIIENGELWLSQVDKCNDTKELEFAHSSKTDKEIKEFNEIKEKYFISSFSDYINLSEDDEFMMWRCYGSNGKGIALVFEVENPREIAKTYLFGKVVYGENSKANKNFKAFLKFDEIFRKKHPGVIQNKNFNELLMISLLLKTSIWKKEKEIRLIGYHNYDNYSLKTKGYDLKNSILAKIYHSLDESALHRAYLKLPLAGTKHINEHINRLKEIDNSYSINNLLPIIKLRKVILGYNIPSHQTLLRQSVFEKFFHNFDEKPSLEITRLRKYF